MPKQGKPKAVSAGDTHLTPITAKVSGGISTSASGKNTTAFAADTPRSTARSWTFRPTTLPSAGRCGRHFGVGH